MAKVHKSHKSNQKYSFQKKKINVKLILILMVVAIVAFIGVKALWYNDYISGTFEVTAPSNDLLNKIALSHDKLAADTDNFVDYGALTGSTDSTTLQLLYVGNEKYEQVYLSMTTVGLNTETTDVVSDGQYARTTVTDFINGVAGWGNVTTQAVVANSNAGIQVIDYNAEEVSDAAIQEILKEIVAIIDAPTVETPAAETTETAE